jgi:hypothetical protein
MTANWKSTETPNVVYLHRATLLDEDVSYPLELGQGRNATNPVPKYSMFAGKPDQEDVDSVTRAIFWRSYTAAVALTLVCVVILANWPN